MKTLFDFIREPIIIGSLVATVLIVIGAYLGSHYYYGDVDVVDIPAEPLALAPPPSQTSLEVDFDGLPEQIESPQTQLESDLTPSEDISIEDFLAELSGEEKQSLAEEVADELPRESLFGLGPYPEIPPDYPKQDIFDRLERYANAEVGRTTIDHELIHRVLIELWKQGKKTDSGILSGDNGRVYPLYKDIVYVKWVEVELEDGSIRTYLGNYLCHGSLADYEESVENGTQPSWMKVVLREDRGIDPYSFLDLP